jgi:uncharacterized membrane protein YesL
MDYREKSHITSSMEVTSMKREFGEGLVFTTINYIWWFFLGNFYFLILNIPLILVLLALRIAKFENGEGLVFIASIFISPAFCALLSIMGKLRRESRVYLTKDFFKAYKRNFLQAFFLGILELICLFMLFIDVFNNKYVYKTPITAVGFLLIALIVLCIGMIAFPIVSRFYFPMKDVIRLSIKYMIKRPKVTMLNIFALVAIGIFFHVIPGFTILFGISGICFLIMDNEKEMLKEIEEMYKK